MKLLTSFKRLPIPSVFIASAFAFLAIYPEARAVSPAPDGGYPGLNTAEGQNALENLTTGVANAAVGWYSLFSNTDGSYNTAVGAGTLLFNVGDQSAGEGVKNTAVGAVALLFNIDGDNNAAVGAAALVNNTTGDNNTAVGADALSSNTGGGLNVAVGRIALTANITGLANTAVGYRALAGSTGSNNTAVGSEAGAGITTGTNIIAIGAEVSGISSVFGEVGNSCYIDNISGAAVSSATAVAVMVDADGKLGTLAVDANGNKMAVPNPLAMLNEFVKTQKKVAELDTTVAQQAKAMGQQTKVIEALSVQLKEQAAQIQKLGVQVSLTEAGLQTALNNE